MKTPDPMTFYLHMPGTLAGAKECVTYGMESTKLTPNRT
jgi:hypothetical protein